MRMIQIINEKIIMGNLDIWKKEGEIMYRKQLMMEGGVEKKRSKVEVILQEEMEE